MADRSGNSVCQPVEESQLEVVIMNARTAYAKPSQPSTPVNFEVPAGACDCHTHVFLNAEKFPFSAERIYTPPPASPEEMSAFHKALHMERVVIVTPSIYGTDNSATLVGIWQVNPNLIFEGEIRLRPQMEVWFCAIAGTDAARHNALMGTGESEQN
jgi:hypothetical protein